MLLTDFYDEPDPPLPFIFEIDHRALGNSSEA